MRASTMNGGASEKHARNPMDFYSTPRDVTTALLDFLDLPTSYMIWEPACGDGAILDVLEERGYKAKGSDIRTDIKKGVGGLDFLNAAGPGCNVVITNPPFNLLPEFICRCAALKMHTFALLTKSTFWHANNRVILFDQHPPAYVLPLAWRPNFCPERGDAPTMDFSWMVWMKGMRDTRYVPLSRPGELK